MTWYYPQLNPASGEGEKYQIPSDGKTICECVFEPLRPVKPGRTAELSIKTEHGTEYVLKHHPAIRVGSKVSDDLCAPRQAKSFPPALSGPGSRGAREGL